MSTPHDKGALTREVKHFPAPRPGGDEFTVRTHEEELPAASEGEIGGVRTCRCEGIISVHHCVEENAKYV